MKKFINKILCILGLHSQSSYNYHYCSRCNKRLTKQIDYD